MKKLGPTAILVVLLALLAASVWWAVGLWTSVETEPLPTELWVAIAGGVIFSIVIGSGLMALVFYSSRAGYDDAASGDRGRRGRTD